jgi:O-antigen ligase
VGVACLARAPDSALEVGPAALVHIVAPVSAARQLAVPLRAALVRYPTLLLGVVAVLTLLVFAAKDAGIDSTTWYPGAVVVLVLVGIAAVTVPAAGVPRLVVIAVVALLAYAAWSYLSIGWANQKGEAWDGANRALLFALLFALFALWRPRGRAAAALLIAFSLGVAAIGLFELLRASAIADPRGLFTEGRFRAPAGYMNADVALWFIALWPCVVLGARRELHPALRGLLVGAAVLLSGLAVLGQSRGWLFTAPVAALVIIALTPKRVRTVLTLAFVLGATGLVTDSLLDVYRAGEGRGFAAVVSDAVLALVVAAVVAGVVAGVVAAIERRTPRPSRTSEHRAGQVLATLAVLAAVVGLVVFVSVKGSPTTVISNAWHDFKTKPSPFGGASRFTGSLGTNRYDFWRVAWDRFKARPLTGVGADNYSQFYLVEGHSAESPRYPHSVELRALSQTGLIGAALLAVGVGAGLWAALRAIRLRRGIGSAAAAAGTAAFVYWLIHGTVDWFYEFPALGGAAFGLLGLAAGLLPRPAFAVTAPLARMRTALSWPLVPRALLGVLALVAALSLVAPWVAAQNSSNAAQSWPADHAGAFDALDTAAFFNPLSPAPKQIAGSIALKLGLRDDAERYFREALERDPRDTYSLLELGALLANRGRPAEATATLARARRLDRHDQFIADTLRRVRSGKSVNIAKLNRQLRDETDKLDE